MNKLRSSFQNQSSRLEIFSCQELQNLSQTIDLLFREKIEMKYQTWIISCVMKQNKLLAIQRMSQVQLETLCISLAYIQNSVESNLKNTKDMITSSISKCILSKRPKSQSFGNHCSIKKDQTPLIFTMKRFHNQNKSSLMMKTRKTIEN